jgi:hypothetical protein
MEKTRIANHITQEKSCYVGPLYVECKSNAQEGCISDNG